ncbi:hypothetical protein HF086_011386 [Spodoptera exigua]|uniref:Uncharacterized protein n=1 Tax=Spodoptera exigua TaxID=7107 RepID=A0A922N008_SPOEX|nr:hypothetical protein HF086_011386 [Spodoptera exigua]
MCTRKQEIAIALSFIASEYLFKPKRRHRMWLKKWLLEKEKYSDIRLLKDLACDEPDDFKNYLRMEISTFNELLKMVTPYLQK